MSNSRRCVKEMHERFDTEICASEMRDSILYCLDGRVSCGEGLAFGKKEYLDSKITVKYSTWFKEEHYCYEQEGVALEAFRDALYSRALCIYSDVKAVTGCRGYFAIGDIDVEIIRNYEGDNDNVYDKYIIKCDIHYNAKDCDKGVLEHIASIEKQRKEIYNGR